MPIRNYLEDQLRDHEVKALPSMTDAELWGMLKRARAKAGLDESSPDDVEWDLPKSLEGDKKSPDDKARKIPAVMGRHVTHDGEAYEKGEKVLLKPSVHALFKAKGLLKGGKPAGLPAPAAPKKDENQEDDGQDEE